MKRLLFLLVAGIASPHAVATEYTSSFGFPFELSKDWLVLTPAEVTEIYRNETLDSLSINADPATAQAILERVKQGEVEFYFDRKRSTKAFKNNISVQLTQGTQEYTDSAVWDICKSLHEDLPEVFGSGVRISSCGSGEMHGIRFLVFEYVLPPQKAHVVQYEIPFVSGTTLLLVAGAHPSALDHVRAAQTSLVDRITRYARESLTSATAGGREALTAH